MNKKGFTLAELLGVIVILGILGIVAIGTIERNIQEGRLKTCKSQAKNIIEGAKMWQIDNPTDNTTNCIKISELIAGGYIEEDLVNPMTEEKYNNDTCVNLRDGYKIEYNIEKGC